MVQASWPTVNAFNSTTDEAGQSRPFVPHRDSPSQPISHPKVTPNSIQNFIAIVEGELEEIEKYLSDLYHVTEQPVWEREDPRVDDVNTGSRYISSMARLRRGLRQRSLAFEFEKWEQATYGTSTVQKWARYLAKADRKLGHMTEFLAINMHQFRKISAARNGLQHGIKLLVCDKLLNGTGILALLIFEYSRIRSIKFRELDAFKDAVKDSQKIKKLADQKADWVDDCQKCYDGEGL